MAKGREYELQPGGRLNDRERSFWRTKLYELGMTFEQADDLVRRPGLDFHEIQRTLERGCPAETAYEIYA